MEWFNALMLLVAIAIFAVPVAMLVIVGIYVLLLPCGFLAGLFFRQSERPRGG